MIFPVLLLAALGANVLLFLWLRQRLVGPHAGLVIAAVDSTADSGE